jgi:methionine biosynthesis protein MetW
VSSTKPAADPIRFDLKVISDWIAPGSRVLDLGCGEGELLYFLKAYKGVIGTGIEHREERVARCIEKGLTVLQGDINEEIEDYPDNAFEYVVLSQTLQQVYEPDKLLAAILRIGKRGIVSFPNFGHWRVRLQLLLTGFAPVTRQLPYQWYDTPNIRVISIKDFRRFSRQVGFYVIDEVAVNTPHTDRRGVITRSLPNLLATYGIFLIGKKG